MTRHLRFDRLWQLSHSDVSSVHVDVTSTEDELQPHELEVTYELELSHGPHELELPPHGETREEVEREMLID